MGSARLQPESTSHMMRSFRGHHVSGNPWSEGSREGVGRPALKSREIALTTVFSGDGILNRDPLVAERCGQDAGSRGLGPEEGPVARLWGERRETAGHSFCRNIYTRLT